MRAIWRMFRCKNGYLSALTHLKLVVFPFSQIHQSRLLARASGAMGVVQLGCSAASSLATGAAQVQHYPMLPGHVLRQMRHTPVAAPRRFCLFWQAWLPHAAEAGNASSASRSSPSPGMHSSSDSSSRTPCSTASISAWCTSM